MRHKPLKYLFFSAAFALGAMSPSYSQPAQTPTIQALAALQPGQWELRERDSGEKTSMCLNDMRALLQVRHAALSCNRFVISNDAREAVVNYTCPRGGHGRTAIKVETPRLVQISTQGFADNEPFVAAFEGRRLGACTATTGKLRGGEVVKGKLTFRE